MKLNVEQRKIVEMETKGHMLIKGVAGSGKTTVAVKRAQHLAEYYCPSYDDKVLLVTYNNTLVSYISHILESDSDYITNKNKIDVVNVDKLTYKYYKKFEVMEGKKYNRPFANIQMSSIKKAIEILKREIKDSSILADENAKFLLEEISWIKACNIRNLDEYQTIDRIGRGFSEEGPSRLLKNSINREAIYRIKELYGKLLLEKEYIDFEDVNLKALEIAKSDQYKDYTHIIIDEGQDLTKVQLEFLKEIYKNKEYSSFVFSSDNTQSIYLNSWIGRGRPYSTIGLDMSGRTRTLNKNYRTTTEVAKLAYSLIENDDLIKNNMDYVEPSLMERKGMVPVYKNFLDEESQLFFIKEEIRKLSGEHKLSDICILYRTKRNSKKYIEYLNDNNIFAEEIDLKQPNFKNNSVKFTTMHSVKGLEFPVIFIVDINRGLIPNDYFKNNHDKLYESDERKLFYVAMTRAKNKLYLLSSSERSKFIDELDRDLLSLSKNASIRPYKDMLLDDYLFRDKIEFDFSKEEKVRQWVIKELLERYNYRKEFIDIEREVMIFSRMGLVDIVVKKDRKDYIFIEVKQFGYGIDSAKEQLLSYMNTSKDVEYGIVTDGIEFLVIDSDGSELEDIPISKKCKVQESIDNNTLDNKLNYDEKKDYKIPILGEVAAGLLKYAEQNYEGFLNYSTEKNLNTSEIYALRVTGDSMIEAGIDKDDFVIVKKQNIANRNDIVIARLENESTMKYFDVTGDMVVLTPANKDYSTIIMFRNDVKIDGIVIDVIKHF